MELNKEDKQEVDEKSLKIEEIESAMMESVI